MQVIPLAEQPIDYAKEAVGLVFGGERTWDQQKYPDLVKFLKYSVVKSLIYNERTSPSVKKRVKAKVPAKGPQDQDEDLDLSDIIASKEPSADLVMIEKDTLKNIRYVLRNDDDALLVMEELIKFNKPKEIASDLGITIDETRNILKRIRRKATGAIN